MQINLTDAQVQEMWKALTLFADLEPISPLRQVLEQLDSFHVYFDVHVMSSEVTLAEITSWDSGEVLFQRDENGKLIGVTVNARTVRTLVMIRDPMTDAPLSATFLPEPNTDQNRNDLHDFLQVHRGVFKFHAR